MLALSAVGVRGCYVCPCITCWQRLEACLHSIVLPPPNPLHCRDLPTPPPHTVAQSEAGCCRDSHHSFSNVVLQPFNLASSGNQQLPTTPVIRLSFSLKIPPAALGKVSGRTSLQQTSLPWVVQYSDPSVQAISRSNAGIVFKSASLMTGKKRTRFVKPTTYSFTLIFGGNVSIVCADGYGGSLYPAANTSTTVCSLCAAGTAGSGLNFLSPCTLCNDLGPQSYSSSAGSASCSTCPATQVC